MRASAGITSAPLQWKTATSSKRPGYARRTDPLSKTAVPASKLALLLEEASCVRSDHTGDHGGVYFQDQPQTLALPVWRGGRQLDQGLWHCALPLGPRPQLWVCCVIKESLLIQWGPLKPTVSIVLYLPAFQPVVMGGSGPPHISTVVVVGAKS